MDEKLLTPQQVAERLQVTEKTVYRWLTEGRLGGLKMGRLWRVRPKDLDAFLGDAPAEGYTDHEPLSAEDIAAIKRGLEDLKEGRFVTLEEYEKERGL